ncbi:MAG TPA: hypothetical protein PL157_11295, partial [Acidobacteriota bacterium]|nr:hypothetical protein [Acidobacteriota bacterium]
MAHHFISPISGLLAMAIDKLFRRNQNSKPNNFEYWLERGKGLLYFVHFDNQLAELAVLEAVDRLITACETEKKLKAERIRKTPNPKFRRRLDLT